MSFDTTLTPVTPAAVVLSQAAIKVSTHVSTFVPSVSRHLAARNGEPASAAGDSSATPPRDDADEEMKSPGTTPLHASTPLQVVVHSPDVVIDIPSLTLDTASSSVEAPQARLSMTKVRRENISPSPAPTDLNYSADLDDIAGIPSPELRRPPLHHRISPSRAAKNFPVTLVVPFMELERGASEGDLDTSVSCRELEHEELPPLTRGGSRRLTATGLSSFPSENEEGSEVEGGSASEADTINSDGASQGEDNGHGMTRAELAKQVHRIDMRQLEALQRAQQAIANRPHMHSSSNSSSTANGSKPPLLAHMNSISSIGGMMANGMRTKLSNRFRKKIRRNIQVSRQLMKFKRIKRHQVKEDDEDGNNGARSAVTDEMLLYDPTEEGLRREMFRLSAFCTCEHFEMGDLIEYLESPPSADGKNVVGSLPSDFEGSLTLFGDVLHIKQKHLQRDIFIFEFGAITFFNFPETKEQEFLSLMKKFEHNSLEKPDAEDFDVCYGKESQVSNDEITLSTYSSLEKLSVAFAVAQCTKLSVYEYRIAKEIDSHTHLSESLCKTGEMNLSSKEISRIIGQIFLERNNVNLHFDVCSTPEFFWQEDKFKPVYDRLFNYLELGKRVDLLNKRLAIMKEQFDMLSDQMNIKHANKLEYIIIYLIIFEVLVMVVWNMGLKDVLGFFNHGDA